MYDIYGKSKVTGLFGEKRPYYKSGHSHQGDDIAKAINSDINAVLDGIVANIGYDKNGYGKYIDIDHGNGLVTRMAHAGSFNVNKGDIIKEGQAIGKVGMTGRTTGPHIHYEVMKDGKRINPRDLEKYYNAPAAAASNLNNFNYSPMSANEYNELKKDLNMADTANVDDLINDYALQMQQNKFQRTPEEEELKNRTIQYLLGKLEKPVQMPNDWGHQGIAAGLNAIAGTRVFNPKTGQVIDLGREYINDKLGAENRAYEKALQEQKLQNDMAERAYNAMSAIDREQMAEDRFMRGLEAQDRRLMQQLAANTAEAQAKRDFDREKFNETVRHNKEIEDIQRLKAEGAGQGTLTGAAASIKAAENGDLSGIKMTAADRKALTENKTTLANIDAGLEALEENPNAYSYLKGILGADIANRLDPKGVKTRTQIDNITAVYRKWLTGAQMSDRERKAYERFLPAPTDNYKIVKSKLEGMKDAIKRSNDALLSNYGVSSSGGNDPMGLGL